MSSGSLQLKRQSFIQVILLKIPVRAAAGPQPVKRGQQTSRPGDLEQC